MADTECIVRQACSSTGETMTDYATREELEAAVMQIHAEIAHDRKRITMIEEFTRELYSLLWVKYRSWRMELEAKLRNHLLYFYSTERTENNVEEVTAEHTHTYPYV